VDADALTEAWGADHLPLHHRTTLGAASAVQIMSQSRARTARQPRALVLDLILSSRS
jgi:hypothetical protein